MGYYFLVASLPMLSFEAPPPMTVDEFLSQCDQQVTPRDLSLISNALSGETDKKAHGWLREIDERERQLRNAIVRERATRLGQDAVPHLVSTTGHDVSLAHAVSEAFGRSDPMEREKALDRLRWQGMEDAAGYDPFTLRALVVYGLKLTIAARWAGITLEAGRERVEQVLKSVDGTNEDSS